MVRRRENVNVFELRVPCTDAFACRSVAFLIMGLPSRMMARRRSEEVEGLEGWPGMGPRQFGFFGEKTQISGSGVVVPASGVSTVASTPILSPLICSGDSDWPLSSEIRPLKFTV